VQLYFWLLIFHTIASIASGVALFVNITREGEDKCEDDFDGKGFLFSACRDAFKIARLVVIIVVVISWLIEFGTYKFSLTLI
jgi:hypothetical protein